MIRPGTAGSLESSDALVEIEPGEGLEIEIDSVVWQQFGQEIDACVRDVLRELCIDNARVRVTDRGALECVLRARVETAARRGMEE